MHFDLLDVRYFGCSLLVFSHRAQSRHVGSTMALSRRQILSFSLSSSAISLWRGVIKGSIEATSCFFLSSHTFFRHSTCAWIGGHWDPLTEEECLLRAKGLNTIRQPHVENCTAWARGHGHEFSLVSHPLTPFWTNVFELLRGKSYSNALCGYRYQVCF